MVFSWRVNFSWRGARDFFSGRVDFLVVGGRCRWRAAVYAAWVWRACAGRPGAARCCCEGSGWAYAGVGVAWRAGAPRKGAPTPRRKAAYHRRIAKAPSVSGFLGALGGAAARLAKRLNPGAFFWPPWRLRGPGVFSFWIKSGENLTKIQKFERPKRANFLATRKCLRFWAACTRAAIKKLARWGGPGFSRPFERHRSEAPPGSA